MSQMWLNQDLTPDQQEARKRMSESYPYVDARGKTLSREEAVARARKYIVKYGDIHDIVDSYLANAFDDEVMEWIVDPVTGGFADE